MGRKVISLIGMVFGKLTVVSFVNSDNNGARWHCHCECGNEINISATNLKNGHTKSCGCLQSTKEARQVNIISNTNIGRIKSKTISRNNTNGVKGIFKDRGRWRACIGFQNKIIYLGRHINKEDAIKARKEAEEKYWKPFLDKIESIKVNQ